MNSVVSIRPVEEVPAPSERDQEVIDLYLTGYSAAYIASKIGISGPLVYKILKKYDVQRPKETQRLKPERGAFSAAHRKVGLRLYDHRTGDKFQDREQGAEKLGWTVKKLALVEKGEFHLTLDDLQDIAAYMNINLSELFNGV